ncbi:MAG: type II toxin-antitoxin system death-on-curing family toxin [Anaerolineales bacterium]|nr:type II toxin-antitoxin system death-on-curing family toxin [Anaerolineales bacterium]
MSRSLRRPFQLARAAGLTQQAALSQLRAAGISVTEAGDLIPKEEVDRAFAALGLDPVGSPRKPLDRDARGPSAKLIGSENSGSEGNQAPPKKRRPKRERSIKKQVLGIVGHPVKEMSHLKADDVEQIHWCLVEDFARARDPIDPPGIKDRNMLESALFRAHTTLEGERKYPTVAMAAAAYLHALIGNHPFHNGNKRTALVATLVFLDLNSYVLEVEEGPLFDYLLRIASHEVGETLEGESLADREMHAIAKWLNAHSRLLSSKDHPLKFHELREILAGFGCEFEHAQRGNRMNIRRGSRRTQVAYRNEGSDVEVNSIRMIRAELGLLEVDGYDSFIFYNLKKRIPDFILKYRRTLDRLARV